MGYLVEALLAAAIAGGAWRIARRDPARNILGLVAFLAGLAAAVAAYAAAVALPASLFSNLFLKAGVPIAASLAAFTVAGRAVRRRLARREPAPGTPEAAAPRGRALVLNALFTAAFLALSAVGLLVVATLMSLAPGGDATIGRTLLLKRFLPPATPPPAATPAPAPIAGGAAPVDFAAAQNRFLSKTGDLFGRGRDWMADRSGLTRLSTQIRALRTVLNLPDEEKRWLARTRPEVWRLTNHPAVVAALEDDRVMRLIGEAAGGDLAALYALGGEPAILALDDAELTRTIRAIDLEELSASVERRRGEVGRLTREASRVPLRWRTATLRSTLELDGILARLRLGASSPAAPGAIDWPDATVFGLAWTAVKTGTGSPRRLSFLLHSTGRLTLFVDGRSLPLEDGEAGRTASVLLPPGRREVAILADFAGTEGPRTCDAEIYRAD